MGQARQFFVEEAKTTATTNSRKCWTKHTDNDGKIYQQVLLQRRVGGDSNGRNQTI